MVTVLLVYDPETNAVSHYTTVERSSYADLDGFNRAVAEEEQRLKEAYKIPSSGLRVFQGGGPTEDSFFRWFPQFKRP